MTDFTIQATDKIELTQDDEGVNINQTTGNGEQYAVWVAWSQMDEFLTFMKAANEKYKDPNFTLMPASKDD